MSLHQLRTHPEFVEGCFGCKAATLELHPGDAAHMREVPKRKWDRCILRLFCEALFRRRLREQPPP